MGSSADLAAELKRMQDELSSLQNEEEKVICFWAENIGCEMVF